MNKWKLINSAFIFFMLSGCAYSPQKDAPYSAFPDVSNDFRSCSFKVNDPWLVDTMLGKDPSVGVDFAIRELIQPGSGNREFSREYVELRRAGKYVSTAEMAADAFRKCMIGRSFSGSERLVECFSEKAVIFDAYILRFSDGMTEEMARAVLKNTFLEDKLLPERVINGLVKDVYMFASEDNLKAFDQAKFEVCMIRPE